MTAPKVSVIIPVYNSQEYLKDCIDSLLFQSLKEIEIICVDDGSTDSSYSILADYRKKDNRVQVVRQENGGAGAARNNGMQYAKGEYLSILDADDFYEADMLEKAYEKAISDNAEIVVFGCDHYSHKTKKFSPNNYSINRSLLPEEKVFAGTDVKKDIFKLFVGWAWDKLFKAEFVKENRLYFQEQRTTNDMLFVFSAIVKAQRITVLDEVLVHHRQDEGTLSVTREKSWHCFYDALTALKNQLIEWNLFERFEQDYINYCVHFSLWNLNTLVEPTHTLLYNKLKGEWLDEMGITGFGAEYFYNPAEYMQYRRITDHPVDWIPTQEYISELNKLKKKEKIEKIKESLKNKGIVYTIKLIIDKVVK